MTDEGPQKPPRGRRARGSADPGPDYPGDLPRRAYPPPQYPEVGPGQRRRATPGDPQAARDYPAPPGEAARGYDRTGAPGEPAPRRSSRPGETAGDYGRAGAPGNGTRGYVRPAAPGEVSGYPRPAAPGGAVSGQGGRTDPGEGRRSYPAAPPRGPYDPGRDAGGRDAGRGREPGPARGRAAAPREDPGAPRDSYPGRDSRSGARPAPDQAPDRGRPRRGDAPVPPGGPLPGDRSVPPGGPGVDGYLTAPPQQARLDGARSSRAGQATGEPPAADWTSAPPRGRRHRPEPHPEAGPAPAVRDRPAERTGPSRHGRAPGGSGVGWDSPLDSRAGSGASHRSRRRRPRRAGPDRVRLGRLRSPPARAQVPRTGRPGARRPGGLRCGSGI